MHLLDYCGADAEPGCLRRARRHYAVPTQYYAPAGPFHNSPLSNSPENSPKPLISSLLFKDSSNPWVRFNTKKRRSTHLAGGKAPNVLTYTFLGLHMSLSACHALFDCFPGVWSTIELRDVTYGVPPPLCVAPALVDCLARGPAAVWHGIAGPGVTYAVSLLLPFVRHTLLFPGFIHSAMVRRQIEVSPLTGVTLMWGKHWLGGAWVVDTHPTSNWQTARKRTTNSPNVSTTNAVSGVSVSPSKRLKVLSRTNGQTCS